MNSAEQQIIADAEVAKAKDVTGAVIAVPVHPLMCIPRWLLRSLTVEQRDQAWLEYCVEQGIHPTVLRAPVPFERVFAIEEKRDLRAEAEAEKTRVRIIKLKAGQERKKLAAEGALSAMPLSGKEALAKIKGG